MGKLSRRGFTSATAAAIGGISATPLLGEAAVAADATTGAPMSVTHFGAFTPIVRDGRFVAVAPFEGDPAPTAMIQAYPDRVYAEDRIKYPMVRAGYLKGGPDKSGTHRGSQDFVRVSWDKAIELVAGELQRVKTSYGNHAIFAGSYGWRSAGKLGHPRTQLARLMNAYGGFTDITGDYSTGASQVLMPYVTGALEVYDQQTSWPQIMENTQYSSFSGDAIP